MNSWTPTGLALHHGRVVSAIDDVPSFADQPWNDGATHNRHVQDAGAVSGEWSEFRDPHGENAREHHGVEQAHR